VKKELGLAFKGNQRMVVEALEVYSPVALFGPGCHDFQKL